MNTFILRLNAAAILWIAMSGQVFGGRLIGPTEPVPFPEATEPETTEAAVTEMADEGDDEPAYDSEMMSEMAEGSNDDAPVEVMPAAPPSRWKFMRSVSLGVNADDNIYLSSNHKESDTILTLAGRFRLLWGLKKEESYLSVDYAPSALYFADHSRANAFDQNVGLAGQWRLAKLTLGAQAGAQILSGGDVDVGERTKRSLWQISLQAKYDYSSKTSIEVTLSPNASNYSRYLDSMEWVNSNWIDYQAFPKTKIGAGLTFGYLKPQGGRAQTYQQALLRITNPISGKLTVRASGGIEFRHLSSGGTDTTPVFRVGASYRPFDGSEFSLEASRRIYSSAASAGQNFTATGGLVTFRQRLFKRYFAAIASGYEDAIYQSTDGQAQSARHDQYAFVRPSVSFAFRKWVTLELYYQYRRNTSTTSFSDFEGNTAGILAGVTF